MGHAGEIVGVVRVGRKTCRAGGHDADMEVRACGRHSDVVMKVGSKVMGDWEACRCWGKDREWEMVEGGAQ